ncbi:hypothetical protein M408DRAFT_134073 [Serendipita vermifera MAFF 305830]|uniref:CENP-V/GFA domain-containing protein n=1 Tax=Serendipita vermifera MAFF 305830 TaxID=933852 RepID=A0A0C3B9P6_SERVB|nr:hypothetical protein M408DRAFT_134073 [Serendipita vermifera MAFF 305830]
MSKPSNDSPAISSLAGGCHCGAITYQFPLPPAIDVEGTDVSERYKRDLIPPSKQKFPTRGGRPNQNKWRGNHCHCDSCRRTVGGLMIDWVTMPISEVVISRNGPVGKYKSSNPVTREFCMNCGTSLFFFGDSRPDMIDITVASLTTPNLFDFLEYTDHLWIEDASNLVLDEQGKGGGLAGILNDGLPKFMRGRDGEKF